LGIFDAIVKGLKILPTNIECICVHSQNEIACGNFFISVVDLAGITTLSPTQVGMSFRLLRSPDEKAVRENLFPQFACFPAPSLFSSTIIETINKD